MIAAARRCRATPPPRRTAAPAVAAAASAPAEAVARGSVLVSRCRVTAVPGEAVTVDMFGSFRGGGGGAAHHVHERPPGIRHRARRNLRADPPATPAPGTHRHRHPTPPYPASLRRERHRWTIGAVIATAKDQSRPIGLRSEELRIPGGPE